MQAGEDAIERFEYEGGPTRDQAAPPRTTMGVALEGKGAISLAIVEETELLESGAAAESQRPAVQLHFLVKQLKHVPVSRWPGEAAEAVTAYRNKTGLTEATEVYVQTAPRDDSLLKELKARGLEASPVDITSDRHVEEGEATRVNAGLLLRRVQELLSSNQLHLPPTEEATKLKEQILAAGNKMSLGTSRTQAMAIGLALHRLPRRPWGPL